MKHIGLVSLILAMSLIPASCARQTGNSAPPAAVKSLPAVEVKSYKGENLSSVNDFRENSIKGTQHVDPEKYRLQVTGMVKKPLELTYQQVISGERFSKVVTLHCVEGWSATILWEGVRVRDLLSQAGSDPKAAVVIFTSYDGYTTSLPLSYITDRDILLADRMNDAPVPAERGFPFVLVAEDMWGYKWAKWITKIEVSADTGFKGYWEQRGYSQEGNLNGSFLE